MIALISQGDALIIVALIGLISTVLVANRRSGKSLEQINRAVNHIGPGEPTLIERVRKLETASDELNKHSRWVRHSMRELARQMGMQIPDDYTDHHEDQPREDD
jgi:hypothetical protein